MSCAYCNLVPVGWVCDACGATKAGVRYLRLKQVDISVPFSDYKWLEIYPDGSAARMLYNGTLESCRKEDWWESRVRLGDWLEFTEKGANW